MLVLFLSSCADHQQEERQVDKNQLKQSMEKANRYIVHDEEQEINDYIARHGVEMTASGSGLRYDILDHGSGKKVETGRIVSLEYELYSIAGDLIYSSKEEGIKTFRVGQGGVESGLEEAVLNLHQGDRAKIIIPSHLAYGLHGDEKQIPPYATLIYYVKLIDIQ